MVIKVCLPREKATGVLAIPRGPLVPQLELYGTQRRHTVLSYAQTIPNSVLTPSTGLTNPRRCVTVVATDRTCLPVKVGHAASYGSSVPPLPVYPTTLSLRRAGLYTSPVSSLMSAAPFVRPRDGSTPVVPLIGFRQRPIGPSLQQPNSVNDSFKMTSYSKDIEEPKAKNELKNPLKEKFHSWSTAPTTSVSQNIDTPASAYVYPTSDAAATSAAVSLSLQTKPIQTLPRSLQPPKKRFSQEYIMLNQKDEEVSLP